MSEPPITNHDPRDSSHEPRTTNHAENDDEISLLDLAIVLVKHKKLVLGLPFVMAILAAIYSLALPNIYTATTKILPPQQSQSTASALLAQLGNLGGGAGIKSPNEIYIAMLKSRTVADSMIQRFNLHAVFQQKLQSGTRAALAGMTEIASSKDGVITIEVDDKDPKRAAELANAYVDELRKLTNVMAVTEASQRRLFFEQQFAQAKSQLAKAEASARQALEKGGLVQVEGQGRAIIESTARLRGEITVKEVQIGAMRTFAADRNPDLQRTQQELESMRRELAKIEGTGSVKAADSVSPAKSIDNLSLLRDLKYYETIYELLARQYEMAKIDEAKDSAILQVLDRAIEPDFKSKPNRRNIVLLSALVALFAGILVAFVREATAKTRNDPHQAERLQAIKRYLVWR